MTTPHSANETEIRQLVATMTDAIRAGDIEGLRALFAPDVVSFDVGPELQSVGAAAKMQNWAAAFTMLASPRDYEIRGLTIIVADEMALAHSFNQISGTVKSADGNVNRVGPWVRYTGVFRKIHGTWLIVHDHVSAPLDFASGRALLNLEPEAPRTPQ